MTQRIAYLVGTYPTLTETFVQREIGALRSRGVDVVVLALRRPNKTNEGDHGGRLGSALPCKYARPDGLSRHAFANLLCMIRRPRRVFRGFALFLREGFGLPPRDMLQLLYHFFVGVGFARDLRRLRISHVHSHFTSATNVALAMHLVDDITFSFTAHASNDLFVRPILLSDKTRAAKFVVAVCEYSRRYLDSLTGYRFSHKIHRVYNGIGKLESRTLTRSYEAAATEASSASKKHQIISVGSLVAPKGHATLIQVCSRLHSWGERVNCRIIGEGPERPTLERLIVSGGLQDSVQLLGALPLDVVYSELLQADAFVLLCEIGPGGYRDGFPTAILEAMAVGLPVLSTALSGIPEMVVDGTTGILVPERNVDMASRALQRLLQSAELRQGMGLRGRARVAQQFDLDDSIGQLMSLLMPDESRAAPRSLAPTPGISVV